MKKGKSFLLTVLTTLSLFGCVSPFSSSSSSLSDSSSETSSAENTSLDSSSSSQESSSSSPDSTASSSSVSSFSSSPISSSSQDSVSSTSSSFFDDPYTSVTSTKFYANYQPATSALDATYRTKHGFISGSIAAQLQHQTIASYQPKNGSVFYRNASSYLSESNTVWMVVDSTGKTLRSIFKGGGYVTLDDVAAYIYAFGDVPANYVANNRPNPSKSIWGKYLRANNNSFTLDTTKYTEPYLPEGVSASVSGGTKQYYECDIGTTGSYDYSDMSAKTYNTGTAITRGTSRICYTRAYADGSAITDPNERYVFYTCDHYYDFQEYLNYGDGWGAVFGYGKSKCNRTDVSSLEYVPVSRKKFS